MSTCSHKFKLESLQTPVPPLEKIPKPLKQQVVDWVVKTWRELQEREDLIVKSFKVCGIFKSPRWQRGQASALC